MIGNFKRGQPTLRAQAAVFACLAEMLLLPAIAAHATESVNAAPRRLAHRQAYATSVRTVAGQDESSVNRHGIVWKAPGRVERRARSTEPADVDTESGDTTTASDPELVSSFGHESETAPASTRVSAAQAANGDSGEHLHGPADVENDLEYGHEKIELTGGEERLDERLADVYIDPYANANSEYVEQTAMAGLSDDLCCDDYCCEDGCCDDYCGEVSCGCSPSNFDTHCGGVWLRAEAIGWWVSGMDAPALVTTSPAGTARSNAGVLGQNTSVLFGGDLVEDPILGGRFGAGVNLDTCGNFQLELGFLFLGRDSQNFSQASEGNPILARPFFNVQTGLEASALVAFPNFVTGSITAAASAELQVWDAMLRHRVTHARCGGVDFMYGYRGGALDEVIQVTEATTAQDAATGVPVGTTIDLFDRFTTKNDFHGLTLGTSLATSSRRWSGDMLFKLSLGATSSDVTIRGQTTTVRPGQNPTTVAQGLLALASNSGSYESSEFSVLPEVGVNLRYRLNCHWTASAGYTLLYWSQAIRAGDVIDPNLNLSQLPPGPLAGAPFPAIDLVGSDFWAQGISLGLTGEF